MTSNERFELLADLFYGDTGYMRPGKDMPMAACSSETEQERRTAWENWIQSDRPLTCALERITKYEAVR